MDLPAELVIDQLRIRLNDLEYENAKLRAQLVVSQNGLVKVEDPSPQDDRSVPSEDK